MKHYLATEKLKLQVRSFVILPIKGNVWSLDFTSVSIRTSGRKLKLIRIRMRNSNNVIRLQCTVVLEISVLVCYKKHIRADANLQQSLQV